MSGAKRQTLAVSETNRTPDEERMNMSNDKKPTRSNKKPQAIENAKPAKVKRVTLHKHANGAQFSEARPGCLAMLVSRCLQATREKPISKSMLTAFMQEKYADRDPAGIKRTCAGQLPCQLRGEKGIIMSEIFDETSEPPTRTGLYYFNPEATDACRKEQGRPPLSESKQFNGSPEKK